MPNSRHYCFTHQGPIHEEALDGAKWEEWKRPEVGKAEKIKYMGYKYEKAPSTGRLHLQGYVQFWDKISMKKAASIMKINGSLFQCRGTDDDNYNYITKSETTITAMELGGHYPYGEDRENTVHEWGEREPMMGARTDLAKARKMMLSGASDYEMLEKHFDFVVTHPAGYKLAREIIDRHEAIKMGRRKVDCYVLYGDTGAGKSSFIWEHFNPEDVYWLKSSARSGSKFFGSTVIQNKECYVSTSLLQIGLTFKFFSI